MNKDRRGNTRECWKDYSSRLPTDQRHCTEARKPVADFCGVVVESVRRWINDPDSVIGWPLIRLRYFLEQQGYKVIELEQLNQRIYELGAIIAFGALDPDQVLEQLGYSDMKDVQRILHGKGEVLPDRARIIDEKILSVYMPVLESMRNRNKPAAAPPVSPIALNAVSPEPASSAKLNGQVRSFTRDEVINGFASLIKLIAPYARVLTSEEFNAEDRNKLRELVGNRSMFETSTMINQLCNETSLRQFAKDRR